MPIYEFRCLDCNREFEIVVSISGYNLEKVECPDCGGKNGKNVERRWSRVYAVTTKKS